MPPFRQTQPRPVDQEQLDRAKDQLSCFSLLPETKEHVSSYLHFIDRYKQKGVDLEQVYKTLRESGNKEEIHDQFMQSVEHGPFAQFLETLPLLANKPGRLGPVLGARVTRTAKPDDEGNSAVDLVVELTNDFLKTEEAKKDKRFQVMRPSTTLFVDVTSNPQAALAKERMLQKKLLQPGKKANVRCFEKFPGVLGFDAPKVLVLKPPEYLTSVSEQFRTCVQNVPGRGFMITDERRFNAAYKVFFASFLASIKDSASASVDYFNQQKNPLSPDQRALQASYKESVTFLNNIALCEEEYKKTHATAIP